MKTAKQRFVGAFAAYSVAAGFLLVGCGGGGSDGSTDDGIQTVKSGEVVTLRVGGAALVDAARAGEAARSVRLDVVRVVTDGRCPADSNCLVAGPFQAEVSLSENGAAARSFTANQGTNFTEIPDFGNGARYQMRLTGVSPNRQTSADVIPPENYRLQFEVERLP